MPERRRAAVCCIAEYCLRPRASYRLCCGENTLRPDEYLYRSAGISGMVKLPPSLLFTIACIFYYFSQLLTAPLHKVTEYHLAANEKLFGYQSDMIPDFGE
jgi:hypothetical protein